MGELSHSRIIVRIQGENTVLLCCVCNEVLNGAFTCLSISRESHLLDFRDTAQSPDQIVNLLFRHSGFLGHLRQCRAPLLGLSFRLFLSVAGLLKRPRLVLDRLNLVAHPLDKPAVVLVENIDFPVSVSHDLAVLFNRLVQAVRSVDIPKLSVNQAALGGVLGAYRVSGLVDGLLALALRLHSTLGLAHALTRLVLGTLQLFGLLLKAFRSFRNVLFKLLRGPRVEGHTRRASSFRKLVLLEFFALRGQRLVNTLHGLTLTGDSTDIIVCSSAQGHIRSQRAVLLGLVPHQLTGVRGDRGRRAVQRLLILFHSLGDFGLLLRVGRESCRKQCDGSQSEVSGGE